MCYWCTAVYKHMLVQVWTQKTNTGLSGTNSHTAGTCLITNSVYSGCEVIAECQNNWHRQHIQLPTMSQLDTLTLTSWQADATILLGIHILKYPHYLFFFFLRYIWILIQRKRLDSLLFKNKHFFCGNCMKIGEGNLVPFHSCHYPCEFQNTHTIKLTVSLKHQQKRQQNWWAWERECRSLEAQLLVTA